jgi:hypothetical protein
VVVLSDSRYREEIVVDPGRVSLVQRAWRPPSRIALAAWSGLLVGLVAAFVLSAPTALSWLCGIVVGGGVYAFPLASRRRAPLVLSVEPGELRVAQGDRTMHVPLDTVRSARVLVAAGTPRHTHGWGLSWGHAGRRVWDLPVHGLGVVRLERDHRSLDVDIASAHPDRLVDAIHAAAAVGSRP